MGFTYEIVQAIGVYAEHKAENGEKWTKEINLVSWNDRPPKVDIREWNSDHTRMSKGITMTEEEAEKVYMALHNFISERR